MGKYLDYVEGVSGLPFRPDSTCALYLPGQDDPQSAVIRDRSGKGNNGTIVGATWARTGRGLWVLSFDGADDYISLGAPTFRTDQAGTIMAWVNLDNVTLSHQFFDYSKLSTAVVDEFRLELVTAADAQTGFMRLVIYQNTVNTYSLNTAAGTLLRGTWQHIALVSTGAATLMYIMGVSKAITAGAGTADGVWLGDMVTDADAIYVGVLARSNDYIVDMTGDIALLTYCNIALSAPTILRYVNQTKPLFGV